MKKRILTGLTLVLTVLLSFSLLSAADSSASSARRTGRAAAEIAKLLPPELSRSLNLVPENAIAVGFVNVEAITKGKLFNEIVKAAGMDWDAILAASGCKKEDADACALFYVKMTPPTAANADALPSLEIGGAMVYKRASTVSEQFAKSEEEIRKGMDGLDPEVKSSVKVEKIKVDGKDAIRVSMPEYNMTVVSIAAGKNVVQFRLFFNAEPVMALIPARGTITPLAASLNLQSAFSAAADGPQVLALGGEELGSPEFKSIRLASCSVTEEKKGLAVVFRIASDIDNAQKIQAMIQVLLDGTKEDPSLKSVYSKTSVTVEKGTDVIVRTFIPSELILQNMELFKAMNDASAASQTGSSQGTMK